MTLTSSETVQLKMSTDRRWQRLREGRCATSCRVRQRRRSFKVLSGEAMTIATMNGIGSIGKGVGSVGRVVNGCVARIARYLYFVSCFFFNLSYTTPQLVTRLRRAYQRWGGRLDCPEQALQIVRLSASMSRRLATKAAPQTVFSNDDLKSMPIPIIFPS